MPNFLNKVFDDFFDENNSLKENTNYNIEKISHDKYMVTIAVPGYKKSNLNVTFNNGVLTIKGKKEDNQKEQYKDYLYKGFSLESFENNFSLSQRLEIIEANLYNGILHIILRDRISDKKIISPINRR